MAKRSIRQTISKTDKLTIISIQLQQLDLLVHPDLQGTPRPEEGVAVWNRILVASLLLFCLTVPHSIAASQTAYILSLLIATGRFVSCLLYNRGQGCPIPARSSIDWPLAGFVIWTLLSTLFSTAPEVSWLKVKTLGLLLLVGLVRSSLSRRGASIALGCLLISALVGVGYSWIEKAVGRGIIVTSIRLESPFWKSGLRPGDVIWMVDRQRVRSMGEVAAALGAHPAGTRPELDAIRAGDPLPLEIELTPALQTGTVSLGMAGNRASRQFRVSGFSRQFLTYAEQMQLLGLLVGGWLLVGWRRGLTLPLFLSFTGSLLLTATRSVTLSMSLAVLLMAWKLWGRRGLLLGLLAAGLLATVGLYSIGATRQSIVTRFSDDSTARRLGYMAAGIRIIPHHPLFGVGMDAHKIHWKEWGFPGDYITHTHSTPIQIALDRGLPALGFLIWFWVAIWRDLSRRYREARKRQDRWRAGLTAGVLASSLGFGLSALTNYNFGDSECLMLWLLLLGIAQTVDVAVATNEEEPPTNGAGDVDPLSQLETPQFDGRPAAPPLLDGPCRMGGSGPMLGPNEPDGACRVLPRGDDPGQYRPRRD
jgi:O-antigen ligase